MYNISTDAEEREGAETIESEPELELEPEPELEIAVPARY